MKILVINCGSSSIKYQLFEEEKVVARGVLERIGQEVSLLKHEASGTTVEIEEAVPDHRQGMERILGVLLDPDQGVISHKSEISSVGHRVVHGGEKFVASTLITEDVIETIREYARLAPLHNPPNLEGIIAAQNLLPGTPQVAVFDTAFHETIPPRAYLYAIPYELYEEERIRRYGFHGTSHRYVSQKASEVLGEPMEQLKMITCHLGNGCSMAAVKEGVCIDTTMGLTPLEGLVMGTRCGDIDAGIIPFLARTRGLTLEEIDALLNRQSGLLGVSGVSNDLREIEREADRGNARAQLALEIFGYRVRKYVGAYTAAMGGLDVLVFTGGIGENAVRMRTLICEDLAALGIVLDEGLNAEPRRDARVISSEEERVRVMIVPTDEEAMIARDTREIVGRGTGKDSM